MCCASHLPTELSAARAHVAWAGIRDAAPLGREGDANALLCCMCADEAAPSQGSRLLQAGFCAVQSAAVEYDVAGTAHFDQLAACLPLEQCVLYNLCLWIGPSWPVSSQPDSPLLAPLCRQTPARCQSC